MGHADAYLIVAGVGGFIAEHDQVELAPLRLLGLDRVHDRRRRGLRVPLLAAGGQQQPAVGSGGQRVADLLLGLWRTQREHHGLAAVLFDQAHGLLDPALLVGADGEAQVACLQCARVCAENHPAARQRHPLDADEDPHVSTGSAALTRSLSGSKIGVEPATSTVTG